MALLSGTPVTCASTINGVIEVNVSDECAHFVLNYTPGQMDKQMTLNVNVRK